MGGSFSKWSNLLWWAPPESGVWKLSTAKIEDYFDVALKDESYGDSIETFVLGFEIGDLEG